MLRNSRIEYISKLALLRMILSTNRSILKGIKKTVFTAEKTLQVFLVSIGTSSRCTYSKNRSNVIYVIKNLLINNTWQNIWMCTLRHSLTLVKSQAVTWGSNSVLSYLYIEKIITESNQDRKLSNSSFSL